MGTPRSIIRARRKVLGLCQECGQRPPRLRKSDGSPAIECEECWEKRKELLRLVIRVRRREENRCTRCGKPKPCKCRKRN